jgi:hypothetical protein
MISASYSKSFGNFSKNVSSVLKQFSMSEKSVVHLACSCTMIVFSRKVVHSENGNKSLQVLTILNDYSSAIQSLLVIKSLNKLKKNK